MRRRARSIGAPAILTADAWRLFATRLVRLFAYGSLSLVLVFYLVGIGLSEQRIGTLLTMTLVGDVAVSLFLTTHADRLGRRRVLVAGSALIVIAGVVFASTHLFWLLLLAGTVGVISPSGSEVGPFWSIEQAALSHVVSPRARTEVFAWYTLVGAFATALGALAGGAVTTAMARASAAPIDGYRSIVVIYALSGVVLAVLFSRLSGATEVTGVEDRAASMGLVERLSGLGRSRRIVATLSALFAMDAFGGGFVVQSFAAYWFYLRFGVRPETLGMIFFWANVFAGLSALVAARLASRIGLLRTMVVTHLPSNVLLILVPLMPTLRLAVLVLLVRFSISQMDVPTRQSYLMAVVTPQERSAAAGVTGVARTLGAAISPAIVGVLFAHPAWIDVPFFAAGAIKIVYDLAIYRRMASVPLPEHG
ncbi:MAG TPA: MFS transporter [Vicinamibacterales bacterium]|nr:MFS transporter [Vicinamibacterales bacterium]